MLRHGDYGGALAKAEIALAMSPNLALAHGTLGETLIFSGRPKEGLAAVQTSIRLDPHDPKLAIRLNNLALGLYFFGEYEAAVEAAKYVHPRLAAVEHTGAGPNKEIEVKQVSDIEAARLIGRLLTKVSGSLPDP